jgi:hypothetical protein
MRCYFVNFVNAVGMQRAVFMKENKKTFSSSFCTNGQLIHRLMKKCMTGAAVSR